MEKNPLMWRLTVVKKSHFGCVFYLLFFFFRVMATLFLMYPMRCSDCDQCCEVLASEKLTGNCNKYRRDKRKSLRSLVRSCVHLSSNGSCSTDIQSCCELSYCWFETMGHTCDTCESNFRGGSFCAWELYCVVAVSWWATAHRPHSFAFAGYGRMPLYRCFHEVQYLLSMLHWLNSCFSMIVALMVVGCGSINTNSPSTKEILEFTASELGASCVWSCTGTPQSLKIFLKNRIIKDVVLLLTITIQTIYRHKP